MCLVYFYSSDSRGAVKEEWIFDRWDKIVKNKNGGGIGIETSDASWERFGKRITPRESCPINFLHGTNRNSTRIHAYTDITARCNSRALPRFTKIEAFHPLFPFVRRLFSFSTRDYASSSFLSLHSPIAFYIWTTRQIRDIPFNRSLWHQSLSDPAVLSFIALN